VSGRTALVVNVTRGNALCVGELADRPLRRMRGLIGRQGLPAGEGMLLTPAPGIHTYFMRFPIDALFLDRDLRVVDIVEQLPPWRMASKWKARAVLELAAGETARCGVEVGDVLALRERRPVAADQTMVAPAPEPSEPTRLHPLRVLVVSDDRQFRSVISLLLARRNCSVATSANASRAAENAVREGADVVVLDTAAARVEACASAVEALARPVGIVVVGENARTAGGGRRTFAKWGPFAELADAIESAERRRGNWGQHDEH
jgi:uncharacterized protein